MERRYKIFASMLPQTSTATKPPRAGRADLEPLPYIRDSSSDELADLMMMAPMRSRP